MREIILIFGKTGSGKTFLANILTKNVKRLIIVDVFNEYEKGIIFNSFLDLLEYHKKNNPENFRYIARFESDLDYDYLFKFCYEVGNLTLLVEEAEIYINPYQKRNEFLKLVRYGRHREISIIGIARRVTELSTDFKAQVNKIYSFKQTLPRDLKIMQELGFENLESLNEHKYAIVEY